MFPMQAICHRIWTSAHLEDWRAADSCQPLKCSQLLLQTCSAGCRDGHWRAAWVHAAALRVERVRTGI